MVNWQCIILLVSEPGWMSEPRWFWSFNFKTKSLVRTKLTKILITQQIKIILIFWKHKYVYETSINNYIKKKLKKTIPLFIYLHLKVVFKIFLLMQVILFRDIFCKNKWKFTFICKKIFLIRWCNFFLISYYINWNIKLKLDFPWFGHH